MVLVLIFWFLVLLQAVAVLYSRNAAKLAPAPMVDYGCAADAAPRAQGSLAALSCMAPDLARCHILVSSSCAAKGGSSASAPDQPVLLPVR